MENYGIKINIVTFIFMVVFFACELQNSIKTQRNDSYQLLQISFKGNDVFT